MPTQLTKNFTLEEFFSKNDPIGSGRTFKAVKPRAELLVTLEAIRAGVAEAIKDQPLNIESGIRSVEYNASLSGSSNNSDHIRGEAADIYTSRTSNKQLGGIIKRLYNSGKLPYLSYTYLITGTSNTRVHISAGSSVARKNGPFGPGYESL